MRSDETIGIDKSARLRGLAHAAMFDRVYEYIEKHTTRSGGLDPLMALNRAIFDSYMSFVVEDDTSDTGWSYTEGADDECVRADLERQLGFPVELSQVVALRRFMSSLFLNGVTTNDVVRIRRMFFGRLAGE